MAYGVSGYWIDSYWGGALCAGGGALIFGSLIRMWRRPRIVYGVLIVLGWSLVWFTRPFESAGLALLISVAIIARASKSRSLSLVAKRIIVPATLTLMPVAAFTLIHNRSVTGDPFTIPYRLAQEQTGTPQSLIFQKPLPRHSSPLRDIQYNFDWQYDSRMEMTSPKMFLVRSGSKLLAAWGFYFGLVFTLPLLAVVFPPRTQRIKIALLLCCYCLAASLLYEFFYPHYIAAYLCIFMYLIVCGMARFWNYRRWGQVAVVTVAVATGFWSLRAIHIHKPHDAMHRSYEAKRALEQRLENMGGKHIVFADYGPNHDDHHVHWFNNPPDLQNAPVLWVRRLGPAKDRELMDTFPGRTAWSVDADSAPVTLAHYDLGGTGTLQNAKLGHPR